MPGGCDAHADGNGDEHAHRYGNAVTVGDGDAFNEEPVPAAHPSPLME